MTKRFKRYGRCLLVIATLSLVAEMAHADKLVTTGGQTFVGKLRWLGSRKTYQLTKGQQVLTFAKDKVRSVSVDKPAGYDKAVAAVRAGNGKAGIPTLEKIVKQCVMLDWDRKAGVWLCRAYSQGKNYSKVISSYKKITRGIEDQRRVPSELRSAYWEALRATNRLPELERDMAKVIKTGDRPSAAKALIARGDVSMDKGDPKKALVDGYLRTILMFRDIQKVQAEALYKAGKAFDKLQDPRGEMFRKDLMERYSQTKYAVLAKEGK